MVYNDSVAKHRRVNSLKESSMKILMVGAGALGGYFGGRLLEVGQDVTFLLRPGRIEQLKHTQGLHIKSPYGDMRFSTIKHLTTEELQTTYDLIIISCKAYSLQSCMDSFAPAVGENTMILPVLNGMAHIDTLCRRFGKQHVLGGLALISATLDGEGQIIHLNKSHGITYGELDGSISPRTLAVKQIFEKANFISECSDNIMQAMWNKWVMISTAVGTTCLFRGAICDAVNAGGSTYISTLFNECASVAQDNGFKLNEATYNNIHDSMINPENTLMASMLKDIEKGLEIEFEAIIADLISRAKDPEQLPMLKLVYTHLKSYLQRKEREKPSHTQNKVT